MEVPRLGSSQSCSRWPAMQDLSLSATYTIAHGNTGYLTHRARPGMEPISSWILVRFVPTAPQLHVCFCLKSPHSKYPNGSLTLSQPPCHSSLNKAHPHANLLHTALRCLPVLGTARQPLSTTPRSHFKQPAHRRRAQKLEKPWTPKNACPGMSSNRRAEVAFRGRRWDHGVTQGFCALCVSESEPESTASKNWGVTDFPWGTVGSGTGNVTAAAGVSAVAQARSLARELPYAAGMAKKRVKD